MESREGNLSRLPSLDVLRGVAIVLVMLVHVSIAFPPPPHTEILSVVENQGVQLFFLVSAYTMCAMYDARLKEPARTFRFYIRRICRIAPLYWVAVAVYGIMLGFRPAGDIVLNILLIHVISPTSINSVVPGGWSIGVEVMFYLFFPFVVLVNPKYRIAVAFLYFLIFGVVFETFLSRAGADYHFLYYSPLTQFPVFLVGMHLYALNVGRANNRIRTVLLAGAWLISSLALKQVGLEGRPMFWIGIALLATVMWLVIRFNVSFWPLQILGRFSYSMYLAHFGVIMLLEHLKGQIGFGMAVLLTLLGTLLIAWVSFNTAERWSQRLGSYLARRVGCSSSSQSSDLAGEHDGRPPQSAVTGC